MSPIFPINLGASSGVVCPDRRVPGFDDTGLCGGRLASVQFHRTAHPCHKDCIEMLFASCAIKTPIVDCICDDGITTEPGFVIGNGEGNGGLIGWNDPLGEGLTSIAVKQGPVAGILGDPGAYYRLFASNDTTDLNCWIDEDDGDPLLINGQVYAKDLVASPLAFDEEGNCTGGVITVSLADLQIEDGTGPAAGHCLQVGGRRAFAIGVYDCNGKRLMFCPFPGILPPPQCDFTPCCNWNIVNVSNSESGGSATIGVSISRPDNCTCTPATVTVTIDGTAYVVDPSLTSALVEHVITPIVPGYVVVIELDQTYGVCDEPLCITLHEETTVTLT